MAYCHRCGKEIDDSEILCPSCKQAQASSDTLSDDVRDNRAIAILSYIGPFAFIPYFCAKRSPFARYHSMRGLNLFILEGIYAIASVLLASLAALVSFYLGLLVRILNAGGWVFLIYVSAMGIVHVVRGQKRELPFVSRLKKYRIIKS